MFKYAQLDSDNIVVGISDLNGEVLVDNMILINELDVELGSTYDRNTNTFTPPIPVPVEPQETLEEKITRIEETNLILMDALATTYEEVIMLRMKLGGTSA